MVRLQHVSFKDWNPIGRPRKKPKEKSENLSESVKSGTSNAENLSKKTTSKSADPFYCQNQGRVSCLCHRA